MVSRDCAPWPFPTTGPAVFRERFRPAVMARNGRRATNPPAAPDVRRVLVLTDRLTVSATTLTRGFRTALPPNVAVTDSVAREDAARQ